MPAQAGSHRIGAALSGMLCCPNLAGIRWGQEWYPKSLAQALEEGIQVGEFVARWSLGAI